MIRWKPIETAPKDGTVIIVKSSVGSVHSVSWSDYGGYSGWLDFMQHAVQSARYWTEYN